MKTICVRQGCDQPRMVSKSGKVMTMCEEHQRAYWREKSRERGGYQPRGSRAKSLKEAAAAVQEKAERTPAPAPAKPEEVAVTRKVHPWRQHTEKPGAAKIAKACPVCGRTPAMAALWQRMGIICMSCRVTPAGLIV